MTEEEIMAEACKAGFGGKNRITYKVRLITFARAIAQKQREIDAGICDRIHDACCDEYQPSNADNCAAAIRGQG
jgi:hypothetical protein